MELGDVRSFAAASKTIGVDDGETKKKKKKKKRRSAWRRMQSWWWLMVMRDTLMLQDVIMRWLIRCIESWRGWGFLG